MTARLLQGMQPRAWLTRENITLGLFLVLLAVWNIPHTIALRYGLGGILLIMILASRTFQLRAFRETSWPLLLFFVYLLVYALLLSDDTATTFKNLKGEWLKFCLFAIVGWGVAGLVRQRSPRHLLLLVALACSLPTLIHSGMSLGKLIQTGEIPSSYWGLHEHHADLGWAALSSTIVFSVLIFWGRPSLRTATLFTAIFSLSVVSLLIAHSRAALVFSFGIVMVAFTLWSTLAKPEKSERKIQMIALAITFILSIIALFFVQSSDQNRWNNMQNRIDLGLAAPPLDVICKGLPFLKEVLAEKGETLSPEQETELQFVNDGDGLRALLFRAGLELVPQYPLGINASKFPYQEAIAEHCTPAIKAAHLHIAWMDTALSIGIPGALLYLIVLALYTRQGIRQARRTRGQDLFALALALTSFVWLVRGFIDSTQRDQMLEMQICLITFFAACSALETLKPTSGRPDSESSAAV